MPGLHPNIQATFMLTSALTTSKSESPVGNGAMHGIMRGDEQACGGQV